MLCPYYRSSRVVSFVLRPEDNEASTGSDCRKSLMFRLRRASSIDNRVGPCYNERDRRRMGSAGIGPACIALTGRLRQSYPDGGVKMSTRIAQIWYSSSFALYGVFVALWVADKLPDAIFMTATACLAGALATPILYWQRTRLALAWGLAWPLLATLVSLGLPALVALRRREILVILLAVVPPMFTAYLLRSRLRLSLRTLVALPSHLRVVMASAFQRRPWEYDFIEHFRDNTVTDYSTGSAKGKVVKLVTDAVSVTSLGRAIFEHPADQGETVIEYVITGIDPSVKALRLQGCYGIMEQFKDDDGNVKSSQFPGTRGNIVRFKVRVNQGLLLQDDRSEFGWARIEGHEPILPREGRLTVQLITNNMGDPSWNWAAWCGLKLVEWA